MQLYSDILSLSATAKDGVEELKGMDSVLKRGFKKNINKCKPRIMECSRINHDIMIS